LASEEIRRRLTAILAADIAGYSRLMGLDEARTVRDLKAHQAVLFPMVSEFGGRIINTAGDGFLAEFTSAVQAVECAVAIQKTMAERNAALDQARRMHFRIGVNIGDVIYDEADIYGDGINVAARLEGIAEPGGVCLSEDAYRQTRGKVDAAFTDIGEQSLKNIARPVRAYKVVLDASSTIPAPELPLPSKPSIAVLPFQNMSGDPEQEYFADGMVEEIVTALSRIPWLFVIARNSSFTYKGRAVNVKQVGRELGVIYVLEGSVRKAGNHIRITTQLIDAISDAHLWSNRFDGPLDDIFELQDRVAASVAGIIEPTLQVAEYRRAAQRPTNDLTAYDLYLQAREASVAWEKQRVERAMDLLGQALTRDPDYGSALATAAMCQTMLYVTNWAADLEGARHAGIDYARRALRVAGDDPYVLANAAHTLGFFGEDIGVALELIDRSLRLNPNFAVGWLRSSQIRLWAGHYDLAIKHCEASIRLSPRENRAGAYWGMGAGYLLTKRFEEAASMLRLALQERPSWAPTYRFLASCYAHMGRLKEAKDVVKRLRTITPVVIPNADHWRIREDREFFLAGLRLAADDSK
jgi:adenylate cyclase